MDQKKFHKFILNKWQLISFTLKITQPMLSSPRENVKRGIK